MFLNYVRFLFVYIWHNQCNVLGKMLPHLLILETNTILLSSWTFQSYVPEGSELPIICNLVTLYNILCSFFSIVSLLFSLLFSNVSFFLYALVFLFFSVALRATFHPQMFLGLLNVPRACSPRSQVLATLAEGRKGRKEK